MLTCGSDKCITNVDIRCTFFELSLRMWLNNRIVTDVDILFFLSFHASKFSIMDVEERMRRRKSWLLTFMIKKCEKKRKI